MMLVQKMQAAQTEDSRKAATARGSAMAKANILADCREQLNVVNEMYESQGVIPSMYPLHADYGECLTVHKAQGSQWKHIGVIIDSGFQRKWRSDIDGSRRWLYTAVTRASETLAIWSL